MAGRASLSLSLLDSRPPPSMATQPKRCRLASTPATPIDEVTTFTGMKFVPSPPLPLTSSGFTFLKALELSVVGCGLHDVPFQFGWEFVVYKPPTDASRAESGGILGGIEESTPVPQTPTETGGESGPAVEPHASQTGSASGWEEIFPELNFENRVPDSSESDFPIPHIRPPFPQGPRKRRFKVLAGRTDPPSTENLQLLDFSPTSYSPIFSEPSSKPTATPTRKSSRLASQTRSRTPKQASTLVEVLDSSSESSSSSEDWVTPEEPSLSTASVSPSSPPLSATGPAPKRKGAPKQGPK